MARRCECRRIARAPRRDGRHPASGAAGRPRRADQTAHRTGRSQACPGVPSSRWHCGRRPLPRPSRVDSSGWPAARAPARAASSGTTACARSPSRSRIAARLPVAAEARVAWGRHQWPRYRRRAPHAPGHDAASPTAQATTVTRAPRPRPQPPRSPRHPADVRRRGRVAPSVRAVPGCRAEASASSRRLGPCEQDTPAVEGGVHSRRYRA